MKIVILSINPIDSIPLIKKLFNYYPEWDVKIFHPRIGVFSDESVHPDETVISWHDSFQDFLNQGFFYRIKKYTYFTQLLLKLIINHKDKKIIYLVDFQLTWIALLIKTVLKRKHSKIVYHEFELVEIDKLSKINSYQYRLFYHFSKMLDLVIVPEENRLNYLYEKINVKKEKFFLLPNTTYSNNLSNNYYFKILDELPNDAFIVGHVGNCGLEHFILQYLKAIELLTTQKDIYFVFVGRMSNQLQQIIDQAKINNLNFIVIPAVPHDNLKNIYPYFELGLILYKPVDLNCSFCAPNKLYEYWSFGIPVIAHNLKGLEPIFRYSFQGKLTDLSIPENIISKILEIKNDKERILRKNTIISYFNKKLSLENFLDTIRNRFENL